MKKYLLLVICAVMILSVVSAQDVSEKKEIAVFSLSYSDWSIPSGALGMVDQQIIEVILNLGRFNVKGLDLRLKASDVSAFIQMIKEANESNLVLDEKFRLGEETFTEADFMELTGSFIIVIPSLTYYESIVKDSADGAEWEVELQTALSFIKVSDSTAIAQFSIDTYGSGETQQEATLNAAEAIAPQLEYELRKIDEFQLKTGVLEILPGGNVIIELGSNMGISVGDEFSIIRSSMLSSGHIMTEKTGLMVVSNVKKEVSYAYVIYSEGGAVPGDQLAEVPRFGSDLSAYGHMFFDAEGISGGTVGVKSVLARGFYDMRPFAGVEIPIVEGTLNSLWPGLPASVYLGGELLWYLGRLQIEPSISVGATGLIPINDTDAFVLSHVGGNVGLILNWMFSDDMRFFIDGGFSYWFSIAPTWLPAVDSYGGIFAGLGVTFKM